MATEQPSTCFHRSIGLKSDGLSFFAVLIKGILERSLILSRSSRSWCICSRRLFRILMNFRTITDLRRSRVVVCGSRQGAIGRESTFMCH